jgi:hypothetical protein
MNALNINSSSAFVYIVILIAFVFIARYFHITLSTVFFIIIALVVIYVLYWHEQQKITTVADVNKVKSEAIRPSIVGSYIPQYPDFVEFLYGIRNFYDVNSNAYDDMVNDIDNFLKLYQQITNDKMIYCTQNLEVAVGFSRNALNHLHSMIFKLNTDNLVTEKYHVALASLQELFQQYIGTMASICNSKFTSKELYNGSSYYQLKGPHPENYYDDNRYFKSQFRMY